MNTDAESWDRFTESYRGMTITERKRVLGNLSPEQRSYFDSLKGTIQLGIDEIPPSVNQTGHERGKQMVMNYAMLCGFVGFVPYSAFILIPIEILLIYRLSLVHQIPFRLGEFGMLVTALWAVSQVFIVSVGLLLTHVLVIGWVAKAMIAFFFVLLFGTLANGYYHRESQKPLRSSR